jgi:hypothetical protein
VAAGTVAFLAFLFTPAATAVLPAAPAAFSPAAGVVVEVLDEGELKSWQGD